MARSLCASFLLACLLACLHSRSIAAGIVPELSHRHSEVCRSLPHTSAPSLLQNNRKMDKTMFQVEVPLQPFWTRRRRSGHFWTSRRATTATTSVTTTTTMTTTTLATGDMNDDDYWSCSSGTCSIPDVGELFSDAWDEQPADLGLQRNCNDWRNLIFSNKSTLTCGLIESYGCDCSTCRNCQTADSGSGTVFYLSQHANACPNGDDITSQERCQAAADALPGVKKETIQVEDTPYYAKKCYTDIHPTYGNGEEVLWNNHPVGDDYYNPSYIRFSICETTTSR